MHKVCWGAESDVVALRSSTDIRLEDWNPRSPKDSIRLLEHKTRSREHNAEGQRGASNNRYLLKHLMNICWFEFQQAIIILNTEVK